MMEKRHGDKATKKEHKKVEERRRVAAYRAEREKKLERVRRAKAAMEENPDAERKGKWPRALSRYLVHSRAMSCSLGLFLLCCNALCFYFR